MWVFAIIFFRNCSKIFRVFIRIGGNPNIPFFTFSWIGLCRIKNNSATTLVKSHIRALSPSFAKEKILKSASISKCHKSFNIYLLYFSFVLTVLMGKLLPKSILSFGVIWTLWEPLPLSFLQADAIQSDYILLKAYIPYV